MTLGDLCYPRRRPRAAGDRGQEPFLTATAQLVKRMAEVLGAYSGPAVGMSFDPDQVVALRELIPDARPRHRGGARIYRRRMAGSCRPNSATA